jgi:UTP--glucose-1-phosphate uridylyltransferase
VLAGGMATRMGGVVKALVDCIPGKTFLDARLEAARKSEALLGRTVPLFLMTSAATDEAIRAALAERKAPTYVHAFAQMLSLRLAENGSVLVDERGAASQYATGHGDWPAAFKASGQLKSFVSAGGKYLWIANLDNLGATVDAALLGHFIEHGKPVQVEVCEKEAGDRGGIPVHCDGKLQVLEEFRLPTGFDPSSVRVFNTNTFLVRADTLIECPEAWTYFEVEKKVGTQVVVQFERLLQELTTWYESAYVRVPRSGAGSRFLPIKDNQDLARRREEIEQVLEARYT